MNNTIVKKMEKPAVYIPLAVFCCLLWSSAFPVIKLGYRLFAIASADVASQILFAGCRFLLAGVLTVVMASVIARQPLVPKQKGTFLHIGILSLVQTAVQYTLFYMALAKIDGSAGSILNASGTFFAVLLAAAVFRNDKLTLPKLLGCVLGLVGIVLIHLKTLHLGFRLGGEGLMLLSAICYAGSSVLIKKFSETDNPALLSGWQFALGGAVMIAVGLLLGGRLPVVNGKAIAVLVYLAFVSAAAYTLWGILLKYNDVSKIAVFGFVIPIGGVILSALLLKEQIDVVMSAVCLAMVSVGIVLTNRNKAR